MKIIQKEPRANGGRPPLQSWNTLPPEGYALILDDLDVSAFQEYRGFVTVTTEMVERNGVSVEVVTSVTGNQEALDAYLTEFPDPVEPAEPPVTAEEQLRADVDYIAAATGVELV